jgi:thiamine biosynthesis lipoprotein
MPSAYFNSVSVLCKDSGKADALSTALFSMSYEDGKKLIEEQSDAEAMWVTTEGKQLYSSGFENFTFEYKKTKN